MWDLFLLQHSVSRSCHSNYSKFANDGHYHSMVNVSSTTLEQAEHLARVGRSDEALTLAQQVYDSARERQDRRLQALSAADAAWYCFQLGLTTDGVGHAQSAVTFSSSIGDQKEEAKSRAILAWLLLELGINEIAAREAAKALSLAEQAGDARVHSLALNVLGVMFWYSKQVERAIELCGRAVEIARKIGDPVLQAWWLINLAGSHAEDAALARGRRDYTTSATKLHEALKLNREAHELTVETGDYWAQRLCLGNAAEYLIGVGDFEGAERELIAYDLVEGKDCQRGREHYLYTLGQTLIALRRYDEAIDKLNACMSLTEVSHHIEPQLYALRYLSEAWERQKRFDLALGYYKRYHEAYKSFSAAKTSQTVNLAASLDG